MIIDQDMIIGFHQSMIDKTGGTKGIRDLEKLNSIVNLIYQTHQGKELYPSISEKASRLCYGLNTGHAFIDGNKRISMHMLALYLRMNNINYKPSNDEVVSVGLALASNQMSYKELLEWVHSIIK